ncbi:hypothetical protein QQS21_011645 [Conoideocrella luteorostrata]|uniref:Uncharacterized protein n=1 Tax=Conoideocrella luteorostrata TaxID=1105319 RepID=A0AAJ0CD12_9HYPO|nr:hypothetical protein QQS21_011645 [Conoideocrella luteorostrata]
MANYGPPFYRMSDGQICRNLLGSPLHQTMYRYAQSQPNLEGPQANFWLSELQTDFSQQDGYQVGAEFNASRNPGREGSYHRTDRVVWRIDEEHLTLTAETILEAKAPANMNYHDHIKQARRDAEEIVRTHQYQRLHVVTTRATGFHAWLYTKHTDKLQSLFPTELQGVHLDASEVQASEEWYRFIFSVKTRPNMLEIHPSQVLRSQAGDTTAGPSSYANQATAPQPSWPKSTMEEYGEPSQLEPTTQSPMEIEEPETSQKDLRQSRAQAEASASTMDLESDWVDVTDNISRRRHRVGRDELVFTNRHGNIVVTTEEQWNRQKDFGRHARVWKKTRYYVTKLP